ncbi:FkbM family methyltransferase [Asticcacaulis sp. 201]|uniref:FkbM family methyltransferase n=1 Tax=Asticcacaulis sp. 201 TaxID=3028787 RepID=UPI002916E8B7|nr:FkbM family methyltransferase [Asticcacaulis sp. 201]MDV6331037.1 FkbM family methyltransferase [Asticcacaulis sp. 201]
MATERQSQFGSPLVKNLVHFGEQEFVAPIEVVILFWAREYALNIINVSFIGVWLPLSYERGRKNFLLVIAKAGGDCRNSDIRTYRFQMTDQILRAIIPLDDAETTYDLGILRKLHSVPTERWTGGNGRAVWGEWNHPGESGRSLTSIVHAPLDYHWDFVIKRGTVAVDIGGHSGDTAIPMALIGYDAVPKTKSNVVVVEPNPAVLPVLHVNLAMNTHIGDFYVVEAAITNSDMDEIELADHGNAECNGGVLEGGLSADLAKKLRDVAGVKYKARGVSMETLFHQIETDIGQPVGFIKIDCEGYDKEIIRPCRDLFAKSKPVLFVEWFAWFAPDDDRDLFDVIKSIDYVPYDPITLQPASLSKRIGDLLCFHKDEIPSFVKASLS